MQKNRLILSVFVAVLFMSLVGCQNSETPMSPENSALYTTESATTTETITLPAGADIVSADLWLYATTVNGKLVNVHRITETWDESTVTWDSFSGAFDGTVVNSYDPENTGWISVSVTSLVEDWISGVYSNHGLLLDQDQETGTTDYTLYNSRESSSNQPYLKLGYTVNGGDTQFIILLPVADAYIWNGEGNPRGGLTELFTGYFYGREKQSILRFEMPEFEDGEGCTSTLGYWKTHANPDKKQYDDTWDLIEYDGVYGPEASFFGSGESWLEVMEVPTEGDEYYILAQQFVAATLNELAGASVPEEVSSVIAMATEYFVGDSSPERDQVIMWAETLDDYNNGVIGPGHCDDVEEEMEEEVE